MDKNIKAGTVEMILAMLISGTIGWFVLISHVDIISVVFWRCLIGGLFLLAVCWYKGYISRSHLTLKKMLLSTVSGVAIVMNWILLFGSYDKTSISVATAVYNTQPFMLVILAAVILREQVTFSKLFYLLISFAGVLAIVSHHGNNTGESAQYFKGILMALGAAFCYALTALSVKKLHGTPPHLITLIQLLVGIVLLYPLTSWEKAPDSLEGWLPVGTLGILHTGVMYILLYGAIQKLPASLTGALSFIYPVAAIAVDWVAFGHKLTALQWAGVAAILLSTFCMQRGWNINLRRKEG